MPLVKIDELEFHTEDLNDEALQHVEALEFLAKEIARLEREIKVFQTAFRAHADEVKREIERLELVPISDAE